MALDTTTKRRSALHLRNRFWNGVGVYPDATLGEDWRIAAGRGYAGLNLSGATDAYIAQTGANNAGAGSVAWVNPENITADDGANATVTLTTGQESNYLLASNFSIPAGDIPEGAFIRGIRFNVEISASALSLPDESIFFEDFLLYKDGAIGASISVGTTFTTTPAVFSVGGPTELFGEDWTRADILNSNWGIAMTVIGITATSIQGRVDYVSVEIWFDLSETHPGGTGSTLFNYLLYPRLNG